MDPDFNGTVTRFVLTFNETTGQFTVQTYYHPANANPNAVVVLTDIWDPLTETSENVLEDIIAAANLVTM